MSRVAHKVDVLGAISKVEQEMVAGILHSMQCSDAQVAESAQSLCHRPPCMRGSAASIHLMSDWHLLAPEWQ